MPIILRKLWAVRNPSNKSTPCVRILKWANCRIRIWNLICKQKIKTYKLDKNSDPNLSCVSVWDQGQDPAVMLTVIRIRILLTILLWQKMYCYRLATKKNQNKSLFLLVWPLPRPAPLSGQTTKKCGFPKKKCQIIFLSEVFFDI